MSIATIRGSLRNFFNPDIASKELHESLKHQRERIAELKNEYNTLSRWNHQYVSTLSLLTEAMQVLIWKKDKDHRYLLANPLHCKSFFGYEISHECLDSIVGRSDKELIEINKKEFGITNSFEPICTASDAYVKNLGETCHFLEAGMIDGKEVLLYSVKTPQFTEYNEFVGSIGMAWDMTDKSEFTVKQLNRWIYSKRAIKLYRDQSVFCYAIRPEDKKCQIFNHFCPTPERGKSCDGECDNCIEETIESIMEKEKNGN